ncbi:hypothetical protein [Photorhabdus temperata]|uniref:Uncharacterized protein n=1 Tax=Photorhabdus temperata subsp. temperata Meg1 TaxID=1393735 RepID=A0A081RSA7_PHOTE|nr:hypothetical protein [Photorhabdus temperata]KER01560.1 hypothetical protein MEG1DRAFT_03851 [Photorhabdus temperata subsp. temperata Meg1]
MISREQSDKAITDAFKEFKDKLRNNIYVRVYKKGEHLVIESSLYVPWCDSDESYLKLADIFDPTQPIKKTSQQEYPTSPDKRLALIYENITNEQKESLLSSVDYYLIPA